MVLGMAVIAGYLVLSVWLHYGIKGLKYLRQIFFKE